MANGGFTELVILNLTASHEFPFPSNSFKEGKVVRLKLGTKEVAVHIIVVPVQRQAMKSCSVMADGDDGTVETPVVGTPHPLNK